MFLATRPSALEIERFLRDSQELPLSYHPVGILDDPNISRRLDEQVVVIGRGLADFDRARDALMAWTQFSVGWIETFPPRARLDVGTNVAVLIRHFRFWSLNGCRIVYRVGSSGDDARFGFAYGTLTNHAEAGEELFEVRRHPETDQVSYRILATSWPRAPLARLGHSIVRLLQARFRRDSAAAMRRATRVDGVHG